MKFSYIRIWILGLLISNPILPFDIFNLFSNSNERLIKAIQQHNLPGVNEALKAGADVNTRLTKGRDAGYTVLMEAIRIDDYVITKRLIEAGADVNADLRPAGFNGSATPLNLAIDVSNAMIVNLLIRSGVDVNKTELYDNRTPLMRAVGSQVQNAELIVAQLVAAGADVNARDNKGYTALIIASNWSSASVIMELIAAGANPQIIAINNDTPLNRRVIEMNHQLAMLLLLFFNDINIIKTNSTIYPDIKEFVEKLSSIWGDKPNIPSLQVQALRAEWKNGTPIDQIRSFPLQNLYGMLPQLPENLLLLLKSKPKLIQGGGGGAQTQSMRPSQGAAAALEGEAGPAYQQPESMQP